MGERSVHIRISRGSQRVTSDSTFDTAYPGYSNTVVSKPFWLTTSLGLGVRQDR